MPAIDQPKWTVRARRALVPLVLTAGLLVASPALAAPAAPAAPPVPAVPADLPAQVEPLASYQGQGICDDTPKAGTDQFVALIKATYPEFARDVWVPRGCAVGGRSEHKEYRAIDWMIDESKPAQFKVAQTFLRWLLATDADGNRFAMARRLGVMYIGWNNMIWDAYASTPGWSDIDNYGELDGRGNPKPCSATLDDGYDTAPCHRDHIHISLSWDGAAGATSFWGGSPTPAAVCPARSTDASPLVTKVGLDFEAIKPTRVYDSAKGMPGLEPCRLTQFYKPTLIQRDDGTKTSHVPAEFGPPVYVPVIGHGRVAEDQVRAVAVRVGVRDANAPTSVYAWASGGESPRQPLLTTRIGVDTAVETVLPVANDGTIAVAVDAGAANVTVDVLGYFVRHSTQPVGTTGSLASMTPAPVYSTRGSARGPLKAGETRLVTLAGRGGLPAVDTPMASVWLTVTTSASRTNGSVAVARPRTAPAEAGARVPVRRLQPVTGAILTGVDEKGRITLTNTARSAVNADVSVTGWSQLRSTSGALLLPIEPVETLDTASGVGVRASTGESSGMKVVGVGRIQDIGVAGVIARVTVTAGSDNAVASLWPGATAGSIPQTLSASAGETRTGLLLLPVSAAGGLRWKLSSPDARLNVRVVGVLREPQVRSSVTLAVERLEVQARSRSSFDPFAVLIQPTVSLS